MEIIPITEKNISGQIINNGVWKSFIQKIKFNDTELLRIRLTFNKKTGEGIIRACTFWENYKDGFQRITKHIRFKVQND